MFIKAFVFKNIPNAKFIPSNTNLSIYEATKTPKSMVAAHMSLQSTR